jgi:hypothetical protein
MSDTVTNLVGNADPRGAAAAGLQNAKVPLSDLFAEVLDKTAFADRMLNASEFGLTRAAERDYAVRETVSDAAEDRADAASEDDAPEVSETDEPSSDGDEAETEGQSEEQAQGDDASGSDQAALPEDSLLNLNGASHDAQNPGLAVQPNTASGVELRSKAEGATPGQARVISNNGEVQAATQKSANTNNAPTGAQDAAERGNSAFGKIQANSDVQQPDAAAKQTGLNGDAAATKVASGAATAAVEKSPANTGPTQPQVQAAAEGTADEHAASLEKQALLSQAGAKRASELHQMKMRLEAHREAIKKAITQSTANSNGTQQQSATSSAGKPTIEVTVSATPPAAAALDGPAARPATLFNSPVGTLPGQAGNGSTNMVIGDTVGNGVEQSASAADRQATASNAARGLGLRPTPGQPAPLPAEQVKVHIQQLVKSGADRIQIKLSPAALGKVEVTLEMSPDKTVQAIVYAEKPETLDMLERDARVLQRAFEEAGMKFDSNSLTFQHGQSGNSDAELAEGGAQTEAGAAADADGSDGDEATDNDQPRRRQHDGMLDLEI